MAGQLADYEITRPISEDGPLPCLRAKAPARLGLGATEVTIWALGPAGPGSWQSARQRLAAAASAHGPGLPSWLEAGVCKWGDRDVVWCSTRDEVTTVLTSTPDNVNMPARLRALAQVARAAHMLHQSGVLHGGVCPQAVSWVQGPLGQGTSALLAPPPIADGYRQLAQVGYPPLCFVDPQLLRGDAGRWSDIWSLGAVTFFVTTGRTPSSDLLQMPAVQGIAKLLASPAVELHDIPPAVAELVTACTAVDPAARPNTADDVANGLDEAASRWAQ